MLVVMGCAPSLALELAEGPLLVVTVHPDDEVLLAPLLTFDATRWMVRLAGTAWDYLVRDARIHASQLAPELVDALESVPARSRRVWLHEPPTG